MKSLLANATYEQFFTEGPVQVMLNHDATLVALDFLGAQDQSKALRLGMPVNALDSVIAGLTSVRDQLREQAARERSATPGSTDH